MKRTVSWSWTTRDGAESTVTFDLADFTEQSFAYARCCAEQAGYPGHRGGWWNYLVDDIRKAFA